MEAERKKIGIIGLGRVGEVQKRLWFYNGLYEVRGYDLNIGTKKEINECNLGVVCVPTSLGESGLCDISIVEHSVEWLETPVILIKSTIPPGTTDFLKKKYKKRIVFSPEYIGENRYWSPYKFDKDDLEIPYIILGGDKEDINYVYDLLAPITGPSKSYVQTEAKTAEMAKYMTNTFIACKVVFANEISNICQSLGIDYREVRELFGLDPRFNKMHTVVFKDEPGYGGNCLPKDIKALIKISEKSGYSPDLLKEIVRSNDKFKGKKK